MEQRILAPDDDYKQVDEYLLENKYKNIFIVFESIMKSHKIYEYFSSLEKRLGIKTVFFSDFMPNPQYESVYEGVLKYKESDSDLIIAIGGGSAMDVAKSIKLFVNMDINKNFLEQKIKKNDIQLLAIPTTAGTGSEATRFAVIYYNGEKQSINDESCIPKTVLFDESMLKTLPIYQKKSTVLDAFSHSIESMWSVNSNKESIWYSKNALSIIETNIDQYLCEDRSTYIKMFEAANLAGRAINISQTTAGHAMCYKLTSLYKISHGHAAALVNSELFPYMLENIDKCCDPRGKEYVTHVFNDIIEEMACSSTEEGKEHIRNLLNRLDLYNVEVNYNDIDLLVKSVNITRLKNNPIGLDEKDIEIIYKNIFDNIEKRKK